jgi:hypothetical protein
MLKEKEAVNCCPEFLFMLNRLCVIFLFVMLLTACKKDTPQIQQTPAQLLTAHGWKIKSLLYRPAGDSSNSDFTNDVYNDCEKDDLYFFGTDSSFMRNDNMNVCGAVLIFGPYGAGSWSANSDVTELSIAKPYAYIYHFKVLELTEASLILEYETTDVFQNKIVYTFEFQPE